MQKTVMARQGRATRPHATRWASLAALTALTALALAAAAGPSFAATVVYDDFQAPGGYTLANYGAKWANPYGLGEMALADTRDFSSDAFRISAAPFQTAFDFGVFDHLKYIGVSTSSFAVPTGGSLTFSSTIEAFTPGVEDGRIINGTYSNGDPYAASTYAAQQAAAVMNMIDFQTGQLFDWFISGNQAFTLIERLPSAVVNPALQPGDPGYVGIDKMYTQIVDMVDIGPGRHDVSITYSDAGSVQFHLDGLLITEVFNVGVPLTGGAFSGVYPAYGPGEPLGGQITSFSIGHGLFSLLDAFPFQHPEAPDLFVSIPLEERIFGQGVEATFDNFTVTTTLATVLPPGVPEPGTWALMIAGFGMAGAAVRRRRARAA